MPTKRMPTGGRTRSFSRRAAIRGLACLVRMAPMNWLFKEEPSHYSFDALVKDKRAVWSGVKNPVAQKHLHAVKRGDGIFYYHTGNEKSDVGIALALGDAYPHPEDKTGRSAVVEVGPVRKLERLVTLA